MWAFYRLKTVESVQEFAKASSKRPVLQVALFFNNSEIDENENLITPRFISYEMKLG